MYIKFKIYLIILALSFVFTGLIIFTAFVFLNISFNQLLNSLKYLLIFIPVVIIVWVLAFYFTIKKLIIVPINQVIKTMKLVGAGDLNQRVESSPNGEIGELGLNFNFMIDNLVSAILESKYSKNKLAESKTQYEAVLESMGDGVFATDKDGVIVIFNKAASQISGLTNADVLNNNYINTLYFVDNESTSMSVDIIKRALGGEKTQAKQVSYLITKHNNKVPVLVSVSPILNSDFNIQGAVAVFKDITKEMEIDKAKNEIISIASHQLRTPLSAISWYTEMLLNEEAGQMNEKQKKYLQEIYHGYKRMTELISALLNISRIDSDTFLVNPEPTNLSAVCKEVIEELRGKITLKRQLVTQKYPDNLPIVSFDKKLIRIIIQNLVSNAIKYTPDNGQITVEISNNYSDQNIHIKISDTGYGIPKSQQHLIFTKLFRADNVKVKDTDGTGLGLYIAKAILDRTGGKISFESQENKGTTFYITLPLRGMIKKDGNKLVEELSYTQTI